MTPRIALSLALALFLPPLIAAPLTVYAQAEGQKIYATSPPYSLVWNGENGTFRTEALNGKPAEELPLTYLYRSEGPEGYAKHLVWFLAKQGDHFNLLWCYLNDSGRDFWCYLYKYPENLLTTHDFKGEYRFSPTKASVSSPTDLLLKPAPRYNGPDFIYGDWTQKTGTLPKLPLQEAKAEVNGTPATDPTPALLTLENLKVTPLHEVSVGGKNGWRKQGWRELHSLAYDKNARAYYLIQYSNTASGYVIDLSAAKLFTANFTTPVKFDNEIVAVGTPLEETTLPETPRAGRYEIFEIPLTLQKPLANPTTDATLDAIVKAPDGKTQIVPGFWDGGTNFRIRIAPNRIGVWRYTTRSNVGEMDGKTGTFKCLPDQSSIRGYFGINPSILYQRHFASSDGAPFFPIPVVTALFSLTQEEEDARAKEASLTEKPALPASFVLFRLRMENLVKQGVNRITGNFVLTSTPTVNEGGNLFLDKEKEILNPEYFRWLDRRIEVCRNLGIVPDFGIGDPQSGLFSEMPPKSLERLWTVFIARYSAYNIAYTLFASDKQSVPENTRARIVALGKLTESYNALEHPISTVASALPAPPPEPVVGRYVVRKRPTAEARNRKKTDPGSVFANEEWIDFVTLEPGATAAIERSAAQEKPVLVIGKEGDDLSRAREMWRTTLRGAYWLDPVPVLTSTQKLPIWRLAHDRLLASTRYTRLAPQAPFPVTSPSGTQNVSLPVSSEKEKGQGNTPLILADPAWEYLVYFEGGGKATLDLLEATGEIRVRWMNTATGNQTDETKIEGGGRITFETPDKGDWVLIVTRR
ncbi:MAG: DUF5060 domain-containing protein [Chthonomonadaceae bacterium]|nr:DUF5060 domain-containing protein [Chthonomonadaceae bacterium]